VKITKSHLKELIKQAIIELKFKSQDDFEKYDKKHNMRADTKVNIAGKDTTVGQAIDVGGPSHSNVKKDEPKKEPSKDEPKKEPSKPKIVAPMDNPFSNDSDTDDYEDWERKSMGAAKSANKKMEIDVLNQKAEQGKGEIIDTEYNGQVTWDHGDPDEDSFMAIDQDGEVVELDYSDIIRFHNDDEDESMLKNVSESIVVEKFGRRFTVKEVRLWMKTLEENRYKKTYNSDCRRVAWLVNHIGEDIQTMPKSMAKKWSKAAYGRERYLAKEFLKSQKQTMAEHKLRKLVKKVIISEVKQIRGINEKKKKL
jgi:2-succinyl-5-enolpyruvyl-6-hydroxy-3-cyclohexene-1-carboxylate synthase